MTDLDMSIAETLECADAYIECADAYIRELRARIVELECAIRNVVNAHAYRDGCTTMVHATSFDDLIGLVGLPRVEGREMGQPVPSTNPERARLDADRTAKPKTEIVGVFPPGTKGFYHNAESLIARPTGEPAESLTPHEVMVRDVVHGTGGCGAIEAGRLCIQNKGHDEPCCGTTAESADGEAPPTDEPSWLRQAFDAVVKHAPPDLEWCPAHYATIAATLREHSKPRAETPGPSRQDVITECIDKVETLYASSLKSYGCNEDFPQALGAVLGALDAMSATPKRSTER